MHSTCPKTWGYWTNMQRNEPPSELRDGLFWVAMHHPRKHLAFKEKGYTLGIARWRVRADGSGMWQDPTTEGQVEGVEWWIHICRHEMPDPPQHRAGNKYERPHYHTGFPSSADRPQWSDSGYPYDKKTGEPWPGFGNPELDESTGE